MAKLPIGKYADDFREFFRTRRWQVLVLLLLVVLGMSLILYSGR